MDAPRADFRSNDSSDAIFGAFSTWAIHALLVLGWLAALVWAWGNAREQGRELRLTQTRPDLREIVARLNLHQLLRIVDSGSAA